MADNTAGLELPVGITENRVLQQIARLESQLRKASNDSASNWVKSNKRVVDSFKTVETAGKRMSDSTRASLQNVGYQVQDIIVQIQGGQGAARALGQQLPQLLSGFGLAGVAAGTLAPLIIGVAASLLGAKDNSAEFEKQLKSLTGILDEYREANKLASQNMSDLEAQFGANAVQARQLYIALASLAKLKFVDQSNGLRDSLLAELSPVNDLVEKYNAAMKGGADGQTARDILVMGEAARTLADNFGLTIEQARQVGSAIDDLKSATTFDEWRDASVALTEALSSARDAAGRIPEPVSQAATNAGDLAKLSFSAAQSLGSAHTSAVSLSNTDVASGIAVAADNAATLAQRLGAALAHAQSLGGYAPDLSRFSDLTPAIDAATTTDTAPKSSPRPQAAPHGVAGEDWGAPPKSRKRSGGTRKNRYEASVTDIQGNIKATQDQIKAFEGLDLASENLDGQLLAISEKQKILTAAQKAGIKLTPEQIAQAEQLANTYSEQTEQLRRMQEEATKGKDAIGDLFGSITGGIPAVKQAFIDLLAQIAKVQMVKGAMGLLSAAGGDSLIKTVGSLLTYDTGGYTGAGGKHDPAGIVHKGEVVWSQDDIRKAGGVGVVEAMRHNGGRMPGYADGGVVAMPNIPVPADLRRASSQQLTNSANITIDVTGATGNAEVQRMVAAGVSQGLTAFDKSLPGRVQSINKNPRVR